MTKFDYGALLNRTDLWDHVDRVAHASLSDDECLALLHAASAPHDRVSDRSIATIHAALVRQGKLIHNLDFDQCVRVIQRLVCVVQMTDRFSSLRAVLLLCPDLSSVLLRLFQDDSISRVIIAQFSGHPLEEVLFEAICLGDMTALGSDLSRPATRCLTEIVARCLEAIEPLRFQSFKRHVIKFWSPKLNEIAVARAIASIDDAASPIYHIGWWFVQEKCILQHFNKTAVSIMSDLSLETFDRLSNVPQVNKIIVGLIVLERKSRQPQRDYTLIFDQMFNELSIFGIEDSSWDLLERLAYAIADDKLNELGKWMLSNLGLVSKIDESNDVILSSLFVGSHLVSMTHWRPTLLDILHSLLAGRLISYSASNHQTMIYFLDLVIELISGSPSNRVSLLVIPGLLAFLQRFAHIDGMRTADRSKRMANVLNTTNATSRLCTNLIQISQTLLYDIDAEIGVSSIPSIDQCCDDLVGERCKSVHVAKQYAIALLDVLRRDGKSHKKLVERASSPWKLFHSILKVLIVDRNDASSQRCTDAIQTFDSAVKNMDTVAFSPPLQPLHSYTTALIHVIVDNRNSTDVRSNVMRHICTLKLVSPRLLSFLIDEQNVFQEIAQLLAMKVRRGEERLRVNFIVFLQSITRDCFMVVDGDIGNRAANMLIQNNILSSVMQCVSDLDDRDAHYPPNLISATLGLLESCSTRNPKPYRNLLMSTCVGRPEPLYLQCLDSIARNNHFKCAFINDPNLIYDARTIFWSCIRTDTYFKSAFISSRALSDRLMLLLRDMKLSPTSEDVNFVLQCLPILELRRALVMCQVSKWLDGIAHPKIGAIQQFLARH